MKTWIKRTLVGVVSLIGVAVVAVFVLATLGDRKLARRVEVAVAGVPFAADAASIERGHYLFRSRGCGDCHGLDGSGGVVVEDGGMLIRAPNITAGPGGATAAYTPADWERTIRHGVKPNGQPVILMPSEEYARYTDADLAAVVAYVRQLPPKSGEGATVRLPLPVRVLYAVGVVRDAAEKIDHSLPPSQPVAEAVTAAHGAYVANGCTGCHRADLSGGKIAGAPPDWPAAARLAPGEGSVMPRYKDADAFAAMLKTGKRPDGSAVSKVMPFVALREMNDVDVRALYLHLTTMPAPR
ncbi:MAG: cytochrome c [Burkholderiales bacterium]|nr:cytochrome c [Burkholderiales bacterium]